MKINTMLIALVCAGLTNVASANEKQSDVEAEKKRVSHSLEVLIDNPQHLDRTKRMATEAMERRTLLNRTLPNAQLQAE